MFENNKKLSICRNYGQLQTRIITNKEEIELLQKTDTPLIRPICRGCSGNMILTWKETTGGWIEVWKCGDRKSTG